MGGDHWGPSTKNKIIQVKVLNMPNLGIDVAKWELTEKR